ncbi:dihydroorotate dehydrogenase [Tulasnella sp. 330]|nr:dihydroorotate dehydrogenase [Tulasnella sp. 330]KAG8880500.1 dihydroorotate dehydrogenase [Tulasnella sp. 331]
MSAFKRLTIQPPILNTACAWASDYKDLKALYECPHTGAITTRTATLEGFPDDPRLHKVTFLRDSQSSINSYGYSPYPLTQYLDWVDKLLTDNVDSNKPIIISIAPSLDRFDDASKLLQRLDTTDHEEGMDVLTCKPNFMNDLGEMIEAIQRLRSKHRDSLSAAPRIAIEINTSCPNLAGHPPPAYEPSSLRPILETLSQAYFEDPSLTFGLKLPPYVHSRSFVDMVHFLASFSKTEKITDVNAAGGNQAGKGGNETRRNPIAFLTCTNTLGSTLLFDEQVERIEPVTPALDQTGKSPAFALPSIWGGLAGDAIHTLALGNVHSFSKLLLNHQDQAMREIAIIGVGGVTCMAAAKRMIAAGASVVGCATIFGKEGVGVFEGISKAFQDK